MGRPAKSTLRHLEGRLIECAIEECHLGGGPSDELMSAVIDYLRAEGPDEMADRLEHERWPAPLSRPSAEGGE